MKKIFVSLIAMLAAFDTVALVADPIIRVPRVTMSFKTNIDYYTKVAEGQKYPNHLVLTESEWSNAYSEGQECFDYFVVKASNADGGRILKMTPAITSSGGMEKAPIFTDVLTGKNYYPSLQTQDLRTGPTDYTSTPEGLLDRYFHYGSLTVDNDVYNILLGYRGSPRYQTISLTWGNGSDLMAAGELIDTFRYVSTEEPSTETKMEISNAKNQPGFTDGTYLFVGSPKEFNQFTVQSTTNFKSWVELDLEVFMIYGDIVIYYLDQPTGSNFFRAFEK